MFSYSLANFPDYIHLSRYSTWRPAEVHCLVKGSLRDLNQSIAEFFDLIFSDNWSLCCIGEIKRFCPSGKHDGSP